MECFISMFSQLTLHMWNGQSHSFAVCSFFSPSLKLLWFDPCLTVTGKWSCSNAFSFCSVCYIKSWKKKTQQNSCILHALVSIFSSFHRARGYDPSSSVMGIASWRLQPQFSLPPPLSPDWLHLISITILSGLVFPYVLYGKPFNLKGNLMKQAHNFDAKASHPHPETAKLFLSAKMYPQNEHFSLWTHTSNLKSSQHIYMHLLLYLYIGIHPFLHRKLCVEL